MPAVGVVLVGAEEAEVAGVEVLRHDVAQELPHDARRLRRVGARARHRDGIGAEIGQAQILQQQAAVGVRVRAHPALADWRQIGELRLRAAPPRRRAPRADSSSSTASSSQMCSGLWSSPNGTWCDTPEAFGLLAVDFLRPGPALWACERRSSATAAVRGAASRARPLGFAGSLDDRVQRRRHLLVHRPPGRRPPRSTACSRSRGTARPAPRG